MNKLPYLLAFVLVFWSFDIYADVAGLANTGLLNDMVAKFKTTTSAWSAAMVAYGTKLFVVLALISLTWTFGLLALKQSDISEFFIELIRFSVPLGFYYWLLVNGAGIASSILQSLPMVAATASGLAFDLSPSGIVDVGFYVISRIIDNVSFWQPIDAFMSFTLGLIILITLTVVAKEMLLLLVSGWVLAYGGVFLLGFGGGRWFSDIAVNYFRTILSIGMQAFGMVLIVGVARGFIDQYLAALQNAGGVPYGQLIPIFITAIMLYGLASSVPKILSNIIGHSGVSHMGSMGLGGGAGSLISAGTTAIAAMSVAANSLSEAAKSLAANAAGTASMTHAAFTSGGGGSSGGANAAHDSVASSTESLARTTNPAKALAAGIAAVAGNKIDSMKDSMNARIGQTIPGQIANEIRNQSEGSSGSSSGSGSSQSANSFSAGNVKRG